MSKENKVEESVLISTDEKSDSVQIEEPKQLKTNKPPGHGLIYFLLFIIIAGFITAIIYFWEEQKNQNGLLKQQDNELLMLKQKINNIDIGNNKRDESIALNNQQLQMVVENVNEAINISQRATERVNRTQRGWALAEIDYLLRMAHRRLDVAKDIAGAIAALKGADSRLEELADLKLFKIRKQLAIDIASLSAIKQADVSGVALAIDQVMTYITELPFKSVQSKIQSQLESSAADKPVIVNAEKKKNFVDSVIETVKQIGDIKIHQRSLQVVAGEVQQKQIEQLLYTHLIGLRLAALSYQQENFIYEIEQTNKLLDMYYESDSNRIKQLKETLNSYKKIQLSPMLPELTKAWEMLQEEISKPVNKVQQEIK